MLIIGCSGGRHLVQSLAAKMKASWTQMRTTKFPDGELQLQIRKPVRGKTVVFVQSFFGEVNDKLIEAVFAADFVKKKGARKIVLIAPYAPYFRQDKEFHEGEVVSIYAMGDMLKRVFDKIIVVDPHLHREKSVQRVFGRKGMKLTTDPSIAIYVAKKIRNPLIIGPDEESYQWAKKTAAMIGCEYAILKKTRKSSTKVTVHMEKKIDAREKHLVIIDDIISTGHTLIETVKGLRQSGMKKVTAIGVHGLFTLGALQKLDAAKVSVVTTDTIPSRKSKISIAPLLASALRR